MRVAIVGCGVIGQRRARTLGDLGSVVAAFNPDMQRAERIGARAFPSLDALLAARLADVAVVATVSSASVGVTQACLDAGLDVLVEKPAARSVRELRTLRVPPGRLVKVGFNHRFHPAFLRMRAELAARSSDPIMFVRARYGNGARVGFDREWRAQLEQAGGGELIDQGAHVIDLARVVLPDISVRAGWTQTHYWDMPVDDNAWAILATPAGQTFAMHVSSSEWKNEFQFDVYTRQRRYTWRGLGRSYGQETLTIYTMKPEMGPPDTAVETFDFAEDDPSWYAEWKNFSGARTKPEMLDGVLVDAEKTLALVDDIYEHSARLEHGRAHPQWWKQ